MYFNFMKKILLSIIAILFFTAANADDSEFFQYREKLDTTLTLKAGIIPTVKIAFGTSTALEALGNMGNCTQNIAAQVGFIAGEPDVSITFE